MTAIVHTFEDPVVNQLLVEALTGRTAVIRQVQQEGEQPCVIITPDEAQAIARAVVEACRDEIGPAEAAQPAPEVIQVHVHGPLPFKGELHVDGQEFTRWLQHYRRMQGRPFGTAI